MIKLKRKQENGTFYDPTKNSAFESEIYIDVKICLFCLFDVISELIC